MQRNFNHFRSGQNRGIRRVKSFNPIDFINTPQINENGPEFVITHSFFDFQISDELKRNIFAKGYKTPTPIQDQAIESILNGRDLVGIANTGTGKTAAFLIPLINKVLNNRGSKILILTPTRELATQIRNEFWDFSKSLNIYSVLCIGGEDIKRQIRELSRNPNFIIATPGRILDLIQSKVVNLDNFSSISSRFWPKTVNRSFSPPQLIMR